jgi:hypothetical protein
VNRAFLIIAAPAAVVLALFGGLLWGYRIALPAAVALLAIAAVALFARRRRRRPETGA